MKTADINPGFSSPILEVVLDLDTDKLTDFVYEIKKKDNTGKIHSNKGGWQSNDIFKEESSAEFVKLKEQINYYLQEYHERVFTQSGVKFVTNTFMHLQNIWANINEKYCYNEWHNHAMSLLSGVFYIKHNTLTENGSFMWENPINLSNLWPLYISKGLIKQPNMVIADFWTIDPEPNLLLIFPSWVEHKAEINFSDDPRISISFDSSLVTDDSNYTRFNQ